MANLGSGATPSGFLSFCVKPNSPAASACKGNIIAQMTDPTTDMTVTGVPDKVVLVNSPAHALELFGERSIAYYMAYQYYCSCPTGTLYVTPVLDLAGSVKPVYTLPFAGAALENGSIVFSIYGRLFSVPVVLGDTASQIATAIMNEINQDKILFDATVMGDDLILTGVHGGTALNNMVVEFNVGFGSKIPDGMSVSQSQTTLGVGNPDIESGLADWGMCMYSCVGLGFEDVVARDLLVKAMESRWACDSLILGGHAFTPHTGITPDFIAYANATNNETETIINTPLGYKYPAWMLVAAWIGKQCCSTCADPSRPVQNDNGVLTCLDDTGICGGSIYDPFEEQQILAAGGAVWGINESGKLFIKSNRTNWKVNISGDNDITWYNTESRYMIFSLIQVLARIYHQNWASSALAENGSRITEGSSVKTPNLIKAELIGFLQGRGDPMSRSVAGIIQNTNNLDEFIIVKNNAEGKLPGQGNPDWLDIFIDAKLLNKVAKINTNLSVRTI